MADSTSYAKYGGLGGGGGGVTSLNSLTGALTLAAGTGISITDNGSNTITITNTQNPVTIGAFGSTPNSAGLTLTGQVLNMEPADATHPGGLSILAQSLAGVKTFLSAPIMSALSASQLVVTDSGKALASQAIGSLTAAGTDGIAITGGTSSVIGSGTSIAQHVSDSTHNGYLSSTDWSTFNSKQSALTLTNLTDVGTDGITITNGTGAVIGASPVTISQQVSDTSHNGYLSSTDWNTFNGKQAAGNYITDLTGDVTASGPGSAAATVAKIQGTGVTTVAPTSLQVLTFDGTNWTPRTAVGLSVSGGITLWPTSTKIVTGPTDQMSLETILSGPTAAGPTTNSLSIAATTALIGAHIYNTDLGVTSIPAGAWVFNVYASTSNLTGTNEIVVGVYKAVVGSGTVTVTGTGTSRTATASSGFFVSGDSTGVVTTQSYLQLPGGFFPITGFTSSTVVTIGTTSGYVNDSAAAYKVHRKLFSDTTIDMTSTSALLYQQSNAQAAFTVNTTDRLSLLFFGLVSSGTHTISYYLDGSTQNTSVNTPLSLSHNSLQGLQGGTSGEYYHMTAAQNTVIGNTSGTNTGDVTLASFGSTPAAAGASLSGQVLTLQPADGTNPGGVSTGTQTMAGAKTFSTSVASAIFLSTASNPASTGIVRLANTGKISWRDSSNANDRAFYLSSSDIFTAERGISPSAPNSLNLGDSTNYWANVLSVNLLLKGSTSGTLTMSPAATTTNHTLTWPSAQAGNANAVLTNDGSGGLSWGNGVTAATASRVVGRDSSANINTNNFLSGYTTTATAAGTTTLVVGSTQLQYFTGTTTQTVALPVTSTLVLGHSYTIVNNSTDAVTVNSSGGNQVAVLAASTAVIVTCILTSGTSAASWSASMLGAGGANAPTVQVLTSGSSATYTTPANVVYLKVRMVGGGGGGGGGGTASTPTAGGTGGNTSFGSLTANGGSGGAGARSSTSSAGGTASGGNLNLQGGYTPVGDNNLVGDAGTPGASSPFGGAGSGSSTSGAAGDSAIANTGSGGGGGGSGGGGSAYGGNGGAAGAYLEKIIASPSATYTYTIGAGGTAGSTNGGGGSNGGVGGSGVVIVEEYYANGAIGTATNVTGIVAKANGGTGNTSGVPTLVGFRVQKTPTSSAFDGTATLIFPSNVIYDTASGYNTSTGVYTIPTTGYWEINGRVGVSATWGLNSGVFLILKKGSTTQSYATEEAGAASLYNLNTSSTTTIALTSGDTISFRVQTAGTATGAAISSDDNSSWFEARLVGV